MDRPPVVLHIGLHKAATRYLQRAVLSELDSDRFLVNPDPLFRTLRRAARNPGDQAMADAAAEAARRVEAELGGRTLVISDPSISGDMYSSHVDYAANLELAYRLFPQANILYFARRQSDWLQSAYRQALVKDVGMPIERFLNYYEGAFQPRVARRVHGVRNVEALTLRFLDIYRGYADRFGPERVYLFRQEDLRAKPEAVYRRLAEALGLEALPPQPERVSSNRAFSALAIHLFYRGVRGAPKRPGARAAAEQPRSRLGPLRRPLRRLRTNLVRHGFDKLIYRDWDLLAGDGMREKLDRHYAAEFDILSRAAEEILLHGPGPNARRVAGGAEDP